VKEEDKNILIGDDYIAPGHAAVGGLGSVFILPRPGALAAPTQQTIPRIDNGSWRNTTP